MKRPALRGQSDEDEASIDDQMKEAIIDAFSANDKVIEIRPVKESKGIGLKKLLLVGAGAIGLAYWARNSQKPNDLIESAKGEASDHIDQATETVETESDTASKRIQKGSERASEAVQEAGEMAASRTEEATEKASERTEDIGEAAAERTEGMGDEAAERMEEAGEEDEDDSDSSMR